MTVEVGLLITSSNRSGAISRGLVAGHDRRNQTISDDWRPFLTGWRGEVRERRVSTRRVPLDAPHSIKDAYFDPTVSTASKRSEVMAGLSRASAVRW